MKSNPKRREGFTLIEVIISMAIMAIISVGVYNAYLLLIRQTKDGEVKQTSTLIGKQLSEEIKSASGDKEIIPAADEGVSSIELTDKIHFTKNGDNYKYTQHFDEKGNPVNSNFRYTAEVELVPKKTQSGKSVSINDVSKDDNESIQNYDIYIIKTESGQIRAIKDKPNDSLNIEEDKKILIEMKDSEVNTTEINIGAGNLSDLNYNNVNKNKTQQMNIDLKYCTGKVTIEVTNETKVPLNLCILNKNDAEVVNKKGILNEYYRSEAGSKIGTLYDVKVRISDERNDDKTIFETSFVQNININTKSNEND